MSTLPLLLLLVFQLAWNINAIEELSDEFGDEQNAVIDFSARNWELNFLQNEFRSWGNLPRNLDSLLGNLCTAIMNRTVIQKRYIPDMSAMSFVLQQNACRNVSIPLTQAADLWTTPGFSSSRPTVIFITGWGSTINDSNSGPVAKAFACRNDTNFVILDAALFLKTFYTWSALNTEAIGRYLAKALIKLNRRYVTRNVHLVGHSLGAQIAGAAGRNYKLLTGGAELPRVTGLDPANPCFYDGNDLPGTRSGDAKYVDIIYTNPGFAGTSGQHGDGNFYVEGLRPIKSGCIGLNAIPCSHQRAVDYFTESVYPNNLNNFKGRYCMTYANLWTGYTCSRIRTATMGFGATRSGMYYVDVNRAEPFGTDANPETFTPSNSACGACNPDA